MVYAVRMQYFYAVRFSTSRATVFTAITMSKVGESPEMLHSNASPRVRRYSALARAVDACDIDSLQLKCNYFTSFLYLLMISTLISYYGLRDIDN